MKTLLSGRILHAQYTNEQNYHELHAGASVFLIGRSLAVVVSAVPRYTGAMTNQPLITCIPCPDSDRAELIRFLTADEWPFFGNPRLTEETVCRWLEEGFFNSAESRSFWILHRETRVGHIRIFDLEDPTPLFDIRIAAAWRGRGLGRSAVNWLIDYCFRTQPRFLRLEAQTRQDNRPMRRVLERCGFVKEAHYREAWPDDQGAHHDGVGYAILRRDWESGITTPVAWSD